MDRKKELTSLGYRHGVYDQNHGHPCDFVPDENLGKYFNDGYLAGYEDAKTRSWYIVADSFMSGCNKKQWYIDGGENGNSWTYNKNQATAFKSYDEADKKYAVLISTVGRGLYKVVWEKNGIDGFEHLHVGYDFSILDEFGTKEE